MTKISLGQQFFGNFSHKISRLFIKRLILISRFLVFVAAFLDYFHLISSLQSFLEMKREKCHYFMKALEFRFLLILSGLVISGVCSEMKIFVNVDQQSTNKHSEMRLLIRYWNIDQFKNASNRRTLDSGNLLTICTFNPYQRCD